MSAGVEISLHIGQRIRHRDYKGQRVTGVVHGLSIDSDRVLQADVVLDAPIVIPPGHGFSAIDIRRQHVPAHELSAFDDRDELIAQLLDAARQAERLLGAQSWIADASSTAPEAIALVALRVAITRATGSAA